MSSALVLNVEGIRKPMEATHASGANSMYSWRVDQLKALKLMLIAHKQEWVDAIFQDLHKDATETEMVELWTVTSEIDYILARLKSWMTPKSVAGPYYQVFGYSTIERKPLLAPGVLVIAPFNYPLQLAFLPLVGSLAGGNPTVIKPSELTPTVSALMTRLVPQYFEPGAVQVVEGSVNEVTELLKVPWGKVVFTGSERVGKIVAQATAKTLTPTLLELGGKSPVVVDETAPNLASIANRIVWGKTFNAGQTCIAPDFVLCHEKHATAFCKELVMTIDRQFGKNPRQSELGRIVSKDHAQRLVDMIKEVERNCFPLCGGSEKCNVDDKYVCPTVLLSPPRDCRLMKEEIFGPVLPVIIVKSRQEAIQFIQQQNGTPLALYVFTKSKSVYQEVVRACPSGGACRNDTMLHGGSSCLPFGGLGTSGYGNYHGRFSFDTFTHAFGSIYRPCFPGSDFGMVRYHPYAGLKRIILVDVLGRLPYIPVLHVRLVATVLFVALAVQYIPAFESLKLEMWQLVGHTLQAMADWALLCQ